MKTGAKQVVECALYAVYFGRHVEAGKVRGYASFVQPGAPAWVQGSPAV